MCGRYYVDDDTAKEIERLVNAIDQKLVKHGEIYPTNQVPIVISNQDAVQPIISTWGYPNFKNKGLIINARSETAIEKPMFRNSLLNRRCLIPASGFFEWNTQKEKFYFTSESQPTIYFCGVYNTFDEENKFVILTTAANPSMKDIHDRMPLILPPTLHNEWLNNGTSTQTLLKEPSLMLKRTSDYEQQRLEFF
jgi:putative SOS response-associated peptidase YedK